MKNVYYIILGAFSIILSSFPYIYGWLKTPPGHVYTGLITNIDDCMVYFSWIQEYASGRFTQRDLFSTELQNPVLFYLWFWVLGLFSKILGTIGAFHLGRVLGGIGLLVAVRWLLTLTVEDEKARRLGFALTCFASGLGWAFGGFDPVKGFQGQPIDTFSPEANTFLSLGFSPLFAPMTALIVVFWCGLLRAERSGKLLDVWPNGFVQRLTDGIVRARFREGMAAPSLIEPGQIYEYTIDLWNTSHVFGVGHAIRLEISSSAFPKYDRNQNTGAPLGQTTEFVTAHQTIYHDAEHPSHLLMPWILKPR